VAAIGITESGTLETGLAGFAAFVEGVLSDATRGF